MFDLQKRLESLKDAFNTIWQKLDVDDRLEKLAALEREVAVPEIWNNPDVAREKTTKVAQLHDELDSWTLLKTQINDLAELMQLGDESLTEEFSEQLSAMEVNLDKLKQELRFTGKYDHNGAILRITAGAGGTEAMDWSGMLERMYLRWAEQHNVKATILDRVDGEEAGIKTSVIEMTGSNDMGSSNQSTALTASFALAHSMLTTCAKPLSRS